MQASCASLSTHLTPRPTPVGHTQVDAQVDAFGLVDDRSKIQGGPDLELDIRRGLVEGADIGIKLYAMGSEFNARVLLLSTSTFDLGVVPGIGFDFGNIVIGHTQADVLTLSLPLLAGIRFEGVHTLVLGLKANGQAGLASSTDTDAGYRRVYGGEVAFLPGGVVGAHLRVSEHFAFFPEINVAFPYVFDEHKFTRPYWQGGLGFEFSMTP